MCLQKIRPRSRKYRQHRYNRLENQQIEYSGMLKLGATMHGMVPFKPIRTLHS